MPPRPPPPKKHRTDQNEIGKLANVLWFDHVPHRAARGDVHVGVYRLTGGVLVAEVQLFGGGFKVRSQDGDEVRVQLGTSKG